MTLNERRCKVDDSQPGLGSPLALDGQAPYRWCVPKEQVARRRLSAVFQAEGRPRRVRHVAESELWRHQIGFAFIETALQAAAAGTKCRYATHLDKSAASRRC